MNLTLYGLLTLLGCDRPAVVVQADASLHPALEDYVSFLDREDVALDEIGRCRSGRIQLIEDASRGDCYRIQSEQGCLQVEGGLLGIQYGLSAILEEAGMGFFHPHAVHNPETLSLPEELSTDWECPQMERRGLHLHSIHPTEGYFDAWESEGDTHNLRRIGDWVIKNRGNHLQWVGLETLPSGWEEDSQALVQALKTRGLTTGIGIQLFSEANLQEGFTLIPDSGHDFEAQLRDSFETLSPVGFDVYNLSFGEFFATEPQEFIDTINLSHQVMKEHAPDSEMTTVLHVGDDLRVEYQGEEWIYYLLAQFADPEVKPWVHTVMYYNLYDDAGGAYHHDEFDQHRALIEDYLAAGKPVGYFPESAYWCAFDTSIPQMLPVYIRSRWTDMHRLEGLDDHVLFSSGWEWGYWLTDAATLRMNWSVPSDPCSTVESILEPLGEPALSEALCSLSELQHQALIEERMAPWIASLDSAMEAGEAVGIIAQPLRPSFAELSAEDAGLAERLEQLASDTEALLGSWSDSEDPFVQEFRDGFLIHVQRARFMAALIRASVAESSEELSRAEVELEEARSIVQRRHAALWDPDPERLISAADNHTLYDFGYLYRSEQLCFWERELIQARNAVTGSSDTPPACFIEE